MTAVRLSGGRAQILAAQAVYDIYGTVMVLAADIPGTAYIPANCEGVFFYSPNVAVRLRCGSNASTSIVSPQSGYFRKDTEYGFALNPGLKDSYISMIAISAGTPEISWIIGAGA